MNIGSCSGILGATVSTVHLNTTVVFTGCTQSFRIPTQTQTNPAKNWALVARGGVITTFVFV